MMSTYTSGSSIDMNAHNAGCLAPSNMDPRNHAETRLSEELPACAFLARDVCIIQL